MDIAIFGCGQMGRACAYALATAPGTHRLTLVDLDRSRAHDVARWLGGHTGLAVGPSAPDAGGIAVSDDPSRVGPQDVWALALPWPATRTLLARAARTGIPAASITRPPAQDLAALQALAQAGNAPLLLPIGLEPGLTELLAAHLAEELDRADTVEVFCGGIPQRPREPLGYVSFFGGDKADHLPIAPRPALTVRQGRVEPVPRFSGIEHRHVPGVGRLQAYHDGMVPWLCDHPALRTATCTQKTLRWPGFGEAVTELTRLGLLDERPVDVDGSLVSPRRVTEKVLAPQLRPRPGDADLVVLDVTVHGHRDGRPVSARCGLHDVHDPATGLSAMARTTGFTLAAATRLLAEGALPGAGWHRPHLALDRRLRERLLGSLVDHGIEWSPPRTAPAAEPAPAGQETR